MPTIYDVPVNALLAEVAKEMKNVPEIKPPEWTPLVKLGVYAERPPSNPDWWYLRCAAVLRAVRMRGPLGVSKLRKKYGGRKNRGHKPDAFRPASGNILRKVLQQLEKAGLIKKAEKGIHKGRIITPKGVSMLDKTASKLYKTHAHKPSQPKPQPQQPKQQPVEEAGEGKE